MRKCELGFLIKDVTLFKNGSKARLLRWAERSISDNRLLAESRNEKKI